MIECYRTDYRDKSAGAVISRCIAHVRARLTRRERADPRLQFRIVHGDGYDMIAPAPAVVPMSMRRSRK